MVTRTRVRRRKRGMTLVEVMVALLVTTVGLLGALASVGVTVRGANFSRNASEASVLVQSKLEQVISLPTGTTTGGLPNNGQPTVETTLDANGIITTTGPYTRTTQWFTVPGGLQRLVQVQVDWRDGMNVQHSVVASRWEALQ
jgi:prepilin-type N-terminal cleavage/methylation domain-containing protein